MVAQIEKILTKNFVIFHEHEQYLLFYVCARLLFVGRRADCTVPQWQQSRDKSYKKMVAENIAFVTFWSLLEKFEKIVSCL